MQTATKLIEILRPLVGKSPFYTLLNVNKETVDGLESEIDTAEADAAFRAVVHELAVKHGMEPTQNVYCWCARRLSDLRNQEATIKDFDAIKEVLLDRGCGSSNPVSFLKEEFAKHDDLAGRFDQFLNDNGMLPNEKPFEFLKGQMRELHNEKKYRVLLERQLADLKTHCNEQPLVAALISNELLAKTVEACEQSKKDVAGLKTILQCFEGNNWTLHDKSSRLILGGFTALTIAVVVLGGLIIAAL